LGGADHGRLKLLCRRRATATDAPVLVRSGAQRLQLTFRDFSDRRRSGALAAIRREINVRALDRGEGGAPTNRRSPIRDRYARLAAASTASK
jgi:hypothetical protein